MDLNKKISIKSIDFMRNEIENAMGNEVFFRGILDKNGIVSTVEVLARGNEYSVPALLSRMKKSEVIIHNHPSGNLTPSANDVAISSAYCDKKQGGSYIVNNEVNDMYIIAEPEFKMIKKINITDYFKEDGKLSRKFKDFEYREEQKIMAETIQKGLNSETKTIIEAGTGTGKTFAYLIPAIEWGILNENKIVVSTNTINLQEQLIRKDAPFVKDLLEKDFKTVLVKGRGNYLCLRKIKNIKFEDIAEFTEMQKRELENLIEWAGDTVTGDRQELNFEPGFTVWEIIASESDMCLGNKCHYREKCFFSKARKQVETADLLITNHHIYFADLAIRKEAGFNTNYSILPNYEVVVFDEAHNIEKVARDYFSIEISKYSFNKTMNNIYNYKGEKSKNSGSLVKTLMYIREENIPKEVFLSLNDLFNSEIVLLHKELYEKGNDFFLNFMRLSDIFKEDKDKIRINNIVTETDLWKKQILPRIEELQNVYSGYYKKISKFQNLILENDEIDDEYGIINDFLKYTDRLNLLFKSLAFIFKFENEDFVYWTEINQKKTNVKISATPLDITNELNDILYKNMENIIFTSATLAVNNSFKYFKNSIGLEENILEKIIHSPFNYEKQMKLIIPNDIPEPNSKEFMKEIKNFILDILAHTGGNAFILFTSYSTLNLMYYMIRDELKMKNYDVLIQGEYPRHKLIDIFKTSKKPVLFGTDSFWEGVDVKGEKLSSVIIVKLPFKVPSEPVVEAVIEKIEKEGGNSFTEYQIPEAVIKLKQGVGRLIRSREDTGIVTILDVRVIKKMYGKIFLDSIPKTKIITGSKNDIIKKLT